MKRLTLALACALAASACGSNKKNKSTPSPASSEDAVVAPRVVGIPGATGAQGAAGPQGVAGVQGVAGAQGLPGERGPIGGGIALFDAEGQKVGIKFEGGDDVADVFLMDGRRALIDVATGVLQAPAFNFFCMYESDDCTGACYVYDRRWLNVIVQDLGGQTWVAPRGASNLGAKTMSSYVHDAGMCEIATIGTLESYKADVYNHATLEFPLTAPLYWDLEE